MRNSRKGIIWIPLVVLGLLISAFSFSRHLDKEVEKYAEKVRLENERYEAMPPMQQSLPVDCWLGKEFKGNPQGTVR